jgi:hypothetical protein
MQGSDQLAGKLAADADRLGGRLLDALLGQTASLTGEAEPLAEKIAVRLRGGRPLLVSDGPDLLAVWVPVRAIERFPWDEVADELRSSGTLGVASGALRGVDGFREARRQAERARAVAIACGLAGAGSERSLMRYEDVALVSLLASDINAARAFVLEELSELADDDEGYATLRGTLLTQLRSGGQASAAETLGVHRNTVAQRVHRPRSWSDTSPPHGARKLRPRCSCASGSARSC